MIRQYRFSELMARLTNAEWTVIQDAEAILCLCRLPTEAVGCDF